MATVSAIYGLGDPESYFKMVMHLSRGEIIDQRGILRQLAELQYTRNDIDFRRGTYRVRGDYRYLSRLNPTSWRFELSSLTRKSKISARFDPLTGEIQRKVASGHHFS